MILGIDHVAIIVSSYETMQFYNKLGFMEIFRKEREYDLVVLMEAYDIQLEIFVDNRHEKRKNPEPLGLRHIAFKVDNIENMLVQLGIEDYVILNDWVGSRYVFLHDPDDNIVELHE